MTSPLPDPIPLPPKFFEGVKTMEAYVAGVQYANGAWHEAVEPLVEAAKDAREAINSLPINALGVVPEAHDCPAYPIRDALVSRLSAALATFTEETDA